MKYQNYKNKLYFNSNKLKQVYKYCRACSSKNIIEVLSLAKTPLEDQFLKKLNNINILLDYSSVKNVNMFF